MAEKYTGEVKFYKTVQGYGFVLDPRGGEKNIFIHFSQILDQTIGKGKKGYKTLYPTQLIEFEIVLAERGPEAHNIRKLESDEEVISRLPKP